MLSGRSAQSGPSPDAHRQTMIDELTDQLLVEKAVRASLQCGPQDATTRAKVEESERAIKRMTDEISRLRGPRINRPTLSSTPSNMSTSSFTSPAWGSASDLASRKRSTLDAGLLERSGSKSRRTTPTQTPPTLPSIDFNQDSSIIDLTGNDEDLRRTMDLLKQEEERLHRNKIRADQDAAFARRMQENGHFSSSPSPRHGPPSHPGPSSQSGRNVFDRMLARPSQPLPRPQPTFKMESRGAHSQSPFGSGLDAPGPLPKPNIPSQMPGTYRDYDSENDSDSSLEYLGVRTLPPPRLGASGPSMPSRPVHPGHPSRPAGFGSAPGLSYMPNVPAVELARQAAMARHAGVPGGGFTLASSYGMPNPSDTVWGPNRPGQLVNGYYDPLLRSNGSLQDTINRTNNYDWVNMRDENGNPLNSNLINYIDDYVQDPRKTQKEIQELLSNIRPDMEIPEEERGETPEALKYPLYIHQQLALNWMTKMEEGTSKGGILADDMGLGKTISTLALMVTRKASDNTKTNLIVGPVALIKQWELEIKKKLKVEHRLSVFLLHGKKATYSDLKKFDVVLTTYGSVASELKKYENHVGMRQGASEYNPADDAELHKKCPLLHPKSKFFRAILDEAQCIKNKDTQGARGTAQIQATHRWCLTGTPMMNGVNELYPLIRFLRIKPYNDQKRFNTDFGSLSAKKATNNQRTNSMKQLQILLKAVMLRRMKTSEINGKPIVTLPEKMEHTERVVFSDDEARFYKDLEGKSQVKFSKYLRAGTVGKNYSNILVLLLRLRQACCHPHLNLDFEIANNSEVSEDQMIALAKSLEAGVIARIKDIDTFECPICYEPVSDPTLVIPCGHDTCSECFANLTTQAEQNNLQNGQEGSNAKCPQCRGVLNAQKTITYSMFQKVHMPEKHAANEQEKAGESGVNPRMTELEDGGSEASNDESEEDSSDDDANSDGDLRDFIVPDSADEDDDDEQSENSKMSRKAKRSKAKRKAKGKMKAKEVLPHELKTLRKDASKNKEARSRYMRYLKKNWEDSAKVTKATGIISKIQETGEKTIVFSQWTSLLDLVEIPLKHELGIKYCRYDGGMSRDQRDKSVIDFVENPHTKVMLVSLRAGNAGLNLTVASHIIIMDPFWNPFIEMQAVDRAHRIGQQKNVHVHRILVEQTVEDRIVELQDRKREIINTALDEGEAKSLSRLSLRELSHLFGVH